jgi:restriction system protein
LKKKRYIESANLSLSEWLKLLEEPLRDAIFVDYQFPTQQHKDEYISSIDQRSEAEVVALIRHFLIHSSGLGIDSSIINALSSAEREDPELYQRMIKTEFIRRLIMSVGRRNPPPWEGITWVIDLLPHFPKPALEGLKAYLNAHIQWLPDGRITGLSDAIALIRAKFIGVPERLQDKADLLNSLYSRDFECIVERLYKAIGYDTELTPPRADGGKDFIARQSAPGRKEELRVECKRYSKSVGVGFARSLLGVVSSEKATKGVLVTSGGFTRVAREFARDNPRIELVSGTNLAVLLNEHLGPHWVAHLERLVAESLREKGEKVPYNIRIQGDQPSASFQVSAKKER